MTEAMRPRRLETAAGRAPLSRKGFVQNPFATIGASVLLFGG